MNPLTQVKNTQKITSREADLGLSEDASWHAKYKDSAYVFVGGLAYDLTEGDLLAVFSQYGEIVDVNLVRDKGTGKSKGFAFIAYEDQRSTILAVDNLNGAKVSARIVRVDHVSKYKKKEEKEEEEEEEEKKEARGVCYAFQKGECNRGASCKFSHSEPKGGDPRWGRKEGDSKWENDKYENEPPRRNKNLSHRPPRNERERETDTRRDDTRERHGGERKRRDERETERSDERPSERKRRDERETERRGSYSSRDYDKRYRR